ncbi:MAG: hypothetical protein ACYC0G_11640, partial [Thiobacillus sp.]
MRSLRVLLAFLIALALPAQALAGMLTAATCCPMAETAVSVDTAATAAHDCCCHDEDGPGSRCASDLSCQCGSHAAISTRTFLPPLPAIFQAHATTPMWQQSVFPIPLWRPPTASSP